MEGALSLAQEHFPKVTHLSSGSRHGYLSRTVNRVFKKHIRCAQALRHLIRLAASVSPDRFHGDFRTLKASSAYRRLRNNPNFIATIPASYPQLISTYIPTLRKSLQVQHAAIAKITKQQRRDIQRRHATQFSRLLQDSPKKAHDIIFNPNAPSPMSPLPAMIHPTKGWVTDPLGIRQALQFSQRHLMSPKVPSFTASAFPWEDTQLNLDRFTLIPRGNLPSLYTSLTKDLFDSCLKKCNNGKAPGPGGIPNELIKHLPSLFLDLLYAFFQVCWKSGFTPQDWKDSTTILLHKKGPITDPQNYRPIGLQQSLYKLWSRTVTAILQNYAEQYNLLSDSQEGFRHGRNCARQLQMLTSVLEDAKLHSQDVYLLSIDFICAFNTIDHTRLFLIMRQLGFPTDAIQVVRGMYSNASTRVTCAVGTSLPIPIRRGTIQGDTLSPFLFILFLEPLLRWLKVNDRGYACASLASTQPLHIDSLAYADDILIVTNDRPHLQCQADKVTHYAQWSGMQVSPSKSYVSTALYASQPTAPTNDVNSNEALKNIQLAGRPVPHLSPTSPFKYLGVVSPCHSTGRTN